MTTPRAIAGPSLKEHSGESSAARDRSRNLRSVVAFLGIGAFCYVVDAGLLLLFSAVVHWPAWAAGSVGYLTSVVVNFLLNRALFSGSRGTSAIGGQTARYTALLGVNYLVTLGGLTAAAAAGVHLLLAKTVLVVLISAWNFFLYRHWVFRER